MARRYSPEKISEILEKLRNGASVKELSCEYSVSAQSISRWKSLYDPEQNKPVKSRLMQMEENYASLEKLYIEAQITLQRLKEILLEKLPPKRF